MVWEILAMLRASPVSPLVIVDPQCRAQCWHLVGAHKSLWVSRGGWEGLAREPCVRAGLFVSRSKEASS